MASGAMMATMVAPVAEAAPPPKIRLDKQTTAIYLFDPSVANPDLLVPAVNVRAIFEHCIPGVTSWQSTTLVQDGRTLIQWGGHSGSGEVSCGADGVAVVWSDPMLPTGDNPPIHSGRATVTMTITQIVNGRNVVTTASRGVSVP